MLNPEVSEALERMYGPVEAHFKITSLPNGNAPEEIRAQWLDISLPIRKLHAARIIWGYAGRRILRLPEDSSYVDAISGEPPKSYNMWPIEVRGFDAVNSLHQAGRDEAAAFWTPYQEALFSFRLHEGEFEKAE